MLVARTVEHARAALEVLPRPLGFVPTMGALHAGHLRLCRTALDECAAVAASLFVNPLQFAPGEDLERYPRDFEADRARLEECGVAVLFHPEAATLYPPDFSTAVDVGEIGRSYEGAARPTHFRGVATVMSVLLNVVHPDLLYLGQKDAQQTAVLRRLVRDLAFPARVRIVPTVREPDGLALSSRNVYLSPQERAAAPTLYAALQTMLSALQGGASASEARERARAVVDPLATVEYLDLVDAQSFTPLERLRAPAFVIGAMRLGATRLIDNLWIA